MIISLIVILGAAALLVSCWKFILAFLNGPVRDLLEKCFGAEKCEWYSRFLIWCDKKSTAVKRIVKMQWAKFKDTVLHVKSKYVKTGNGYLKTTETLVRTGEKSARRIVSEEPIGWEDLPNGVREEMIKRRTNEGEIDDRELIAEKVRQRAAEDGIELIA